MIISENGNHSCYKWKSGKAENLGRQAAKIPDWLRFGIRFPTMGSQVGYD
jgi:hypothetical protein